tara:strand:+ start:322 stop:588 length:267 start_codon:yes stop_codon:yes gene_type:complete
MRLKFETLLDVQDYYGSSDFQIEARYDKFDGEEYIMLRFGYWAKVNVSKLNGLFLSTPYEVIENGIEDEDTGWKYSYHIKNNWINNIK